eukprot:CAMPEP_0183739420 /NCGR_PEP_ID=MMETSP0737-20130205/57008_1 /TAXON_ID=385413 /ORGANISM="Thalassiosira miniscula, Strain CCMP1093" /LENGTH=597 /DNA_ID=CAMNT_0025974217 /DNA_START=98 /DNA_END=1891 /DNA_ORIENTATION=-
MAVPLSESQTRLVCASHRSDYVTLVPQAISSSTPTPNSPRQGDRSSSSRLRSLFGAPTRYHQFLGAAFQQRFFDDDVDHALPASPSVAVAVLPPAFANYVISSAVKDVLRYSLLKRALGVSNVDLPLVVGGCDSCCAAMDVLIRLHGAWDVRKAGLVASWSGPALAAVLYGAGVVVVAAVSMMAHLDGYGRYHFLFLVLFTIGSYFMNIGAGLLWNVWTQTFKHQAERRLECDTASAKYVSVLGSEGSEQEIINSALRGVDVQGKLSQLQVLLRYAASSIAPLLATSLMTQTGATASYAIVAVCSISLAVLMAFIVNRLEGEEESKSTRRQRKRPGVIVGWAEMLPVWVTSCFCFRSRLIEICRNTELEPLKLELEGGNTEIVRNNDKAGQFSAAFFHAGMFGSLTEVVRGGYTRVLCLRAATSDLSHGDLARALSIAGVTAVLLFWLSDVADRSRRLAASIGFAILGLGHIGLALSSSTAGFYASAALFGLGEAVSTGLRALVKQDYLHERGPIGPLTEGCDDDGGRMVRRQVCNKTGIWTDVTLIANALVVGVVGRYLGMRVASLTYGMLAVYAVYFSACVLPDTKPQQQGRQIA